jgi:transcriptional regulator with XRE-family HTH domain
MRPWLTTRDATRVYRQLQKIGFTQQRIAAITGQSQPEVSAIIHGRRVMAYDVLYRIFSSLGVPLCLVGLASCCPCCPHQPPGDSTGQPLPPPVPPLGPIPAERESGAASQLWKPTAHHAAGSCPPQHLGARLLG